MVHVEKDNFLLLVAPPVMQNENKTTQDLFVAPLQSRRFFFLCPSLAHIFVILLGLCFCDCHGKVRPMVVHPESVVTKRDCDCRIHNFLFLPCLPGHVLLLTP